MLSTQPTLQLPGTERFHGLDAARAIALLIGIFHHGIESFISYTKWDWVTQDSQSSLLLDVLFYVSHVFRMQAFFLMSGFFAHLLFTRRGFRGFLINRTKRLLLPFVIFWPILYGATYSMWVWGVQFLKHCSYDEAVFRLPNYMVWSKGFPLMHLWFLYFLILFCAGVVLVRPLVSFVDKHNNIRIAVDIALSFCMNRWWGSLAIGFVMMPSMLGMTDWFGVDTSASGLLPRIAPFILYGLYFTLGWFLYRQFILLRNMERFRMHNLIMSFVLISSLIAISLIFSEPAPDKAQLVLMSLNAVYTFASITTVFAFIGFMMKFFSVQSPTVRYLSDASYWGYLIHLPLLAYLQILVAPYDWFWGWKLLIIFVPGIFLLTVSYQYGVRGTIVGVLLNGKEVKVKGKR